jgi:hypothetical protein
VNSSESLRKTTVRLLPQAFDQKKKKGRGTALSHCIFLLPVGLADLMSTLDRFHKIVNWDFASR